MQHSDLGASHTPQSDVSGEFINLLGDTFYRIGNYDSMSPFFMTIVSSGDHWLFVSTTGGLSAGRINPDHALFPYYTVDRIEENAENTGSKTIIQVLHHHHQHVWEPFSHRRFSTFTLQRALYKNTAGTAVIFEEVNVDLGLSFRYAWRTSQTFGLVKTAWLVNHSAEPRSVTVTDGLQNILPAQVASGTQNEFSVLLDAYKRSELDPQTGLGLFSLSSRLTDLAEPSEALRANTVWHVGLDHVKHLISSAQLDGIRQGRAARQETDVRGKRGAYFVQAIFDLPAGAERTWHLVAEVDQDGAKVANLNRRLRSASSDLYATVAQDIAETSEHLKQIIGGADGQQASGDPLSAEHHFANVLYNVMRGGTFADQYRIGKADLLAYIHTHDRNLLEQQADFVAGLPDTFTTQQLKQLADSLGNAELVRLCYTYMPLTFSRRHGDPSRPWNRFAIRLTNPDGTPQLNYEGNWRDIFQNWEALAFAYPEFIDSMLCVFLNATTVDGYNPYRITRDGIDWEVPEPNNPWANIGYWSDHQIIYLQKLMEVCERFYPGKLQSLLTRPVFAYANVPYRIKHYQEITRDPYNTITFDWDTEHEIESRVKAHGTDGKLLQDKRGKVVTTTLAEKLLNLLLAKLANFVPDGGIWMNTQRPEWNDANNALVGKGLSVVTVAYLRRFVDFFRQILRGSSDDLLVTQELHGLFAAIHSTLTTANLALSPMSDAQRRAVLDAFGSAASDYRWQCYENGLSGEMVGISRDQLTAFLALVETAIDTTLAANRRDDAMYHAYNTLELHDGAARVHHLYPMLEGQVAILSSGLLTPEAALELLTQLRQSALYREDQHSYILYPDRDLAGFLSKNTLDGARAGALKLVQTLIQRNDPRLVVRDEAGAYHFGGDIRNARDVSAVLKTLAKDPELADMVAAESAVILDLFEQVFKHAQFTGRSGSFFAYEGLGSIYWHMVSKLLLAVQENIYHAAAVQSEAVSGLIDAYYDIRAGLGFNKSPDVYGAFPLDPYSHTPRDQGAKQPGMTGMVKEEILTRLGELGIVIEDGQIVLQPLLLRDVEFLKSPSTLRYWDVDDAEQQLPVPAGALAFTFCRVPVIVLRSDRNGFVAHINDGHQETVAETRLGRDLSQHIFAHDGIVRQVTIYTHPG
jgi:hypothetical protein